MTLEWYKPDPTIFIIKSTDPKKPKLYYACTSPLDGDKKSKSNESIVTNELVEWYGKIREILDKQQTLKLLLEAPQDVSRTLNNKIVKML